MEPLTSPEAAPDLGSGLRRWAVFALCLGLLACGRSAPEGFRNTDISGGAFGHTLTDFRDHRGQPVTLETFKGKTVILFFGYTRCPDVCPTTLTRLATVMKTLGDAARAVQVLMITVDPAHDTPERLAAYLRAFDPGFLGLYGDPAATATAARSFKVFYAPAESAVTEHPATHGDPAASAATDGHSHDHHDAGKAARTPSSATAVIDHSAGAYVFDAQGAIRLYVRDDASVADIATDLKRLLNEAHAS